MTARMGLKILVATSSSRDADTEALARGAIASVLKPCEWDELQGKITRSITSRYGHPYESLR
jgi:hypothetical protein